MDSDSSLSSYESADVVPLEDDEATVSDVGADASDEATVSDVGADASDEATVSDIGAVNDGSDEASTAVINPSQLPADSASSATSRIGVPYVDGIELDERDFVDYGERRRLLLGGDGSAADDLRMRGRAAFVSRGRWMASARLPTARVLWFHLRLSHPSEFDDDVLRWTRVAVDGGVRVIDIDYSDPESGDVNPHECRGYGMLPHDVYSLGDSLQAMRLSACDFDPLRIGALRGLRKLCLEKIQLSPQAVEFLAEGCHYLDEITLRKLGLLSYFHFSGHYLERLTIEECLPMLLGIKVDSPALQHFRYRGCVAPIEVDAHHSLRVASVDFSNQRELYRHAGLLSEILLLLKNARDLTICSYFTRFIATSDMEHSQLPTPIVLTKRLTLIKSTLAADELQGIAFLLKSYPSLEEFTIQLGGRREVSTWFLRNEDMYRAPDDAKAFWESVPASGTISCLQNCLKKVVLKGFKAGVDEMEFARFMLANAMILEEFCVGIDHEDMISARKFQEYIAAIYFVQNLPKASPVVQIAVR